MDNEQKLRIIKRYDNRKLYDTKQSRYITINDLVTMVNENIDFVVIDNSSKSDITYMLLVKALSSHLTTNIKSNSFVKNIINNG